ncbi:MAG: Ig-like domain-containing protein [Oscillospiraceae bacterium]|nr:Ig-like domain-containing protein [Oscillospiraceae bacterium]
MGLRNGAKCGRCDRRYSVLRSRCPYCGASRNKGSKRVSSSDNSIWPLVVGLLILFVLIAAVIVLLTTTLAADRRARSEEEKKQKDTGIEEDYEQGDGVDDLVDTNDPVLTPPDTGTPPDDTGTPPDDGNEVRQAVESVIMKYAGSELTKCSEEGADYDISMSTGEKLNLTYETTPAVENAEVLWESADQNIVMVLQSGQITAVGRGTTTVTLTVNGTSAVCKIRVG